METISNILITYNHKISKFNVPNQNFTNFFDI